MENFDYLEEANVTLSNNFHGELVSKIGLYVALDRAIEAMKILDHIKKALFYGRKSEGTYRLPNEPDIPLEALDSDVSRAVVILHGILGHATESGEMLEALMKGLIGAGFDGTNLMEEIGDSFWYDAILLRLYGKTFDDVQRTNIAKLRARFPNKFSEYDANNRNLEAERKILEQG